MKPLDANLLRDIAVGGDPALLANLASLLPGAMQEAKIDTPLRIAHFLAQICEESWSFTRLSENLNYSEFRIKTLWPKLAGRAAQLAAHPQALANAIYAGRYGNGDEASGDGWRFRGRGLLQHTFRDNYAELARALDLPLVDQPEKLEEPAVAVKAAIWFFIARSCLAFADADDIREVTIRINGGTNGVADRAIFKHRALTLLSEPRPAANRAQQQHTEK